MFLPVKWTWRCDLQFELERRERSNTIKCLCGNYRFISKAWIILNRHKSDDPRLRFPSYGLQINDSPLRSCLKITASKRRSNWTSCFKEADWINESREACRLQAIHIDSDSHLIKRLTLKFPRSKISLHQSCFLFQRGSLATDDCCREAKPLATCGLVLMLPSGPIDLKCLDSTRCEANLFVEVITAYLPCGRQ